MDDPNITMEDYIRLEEEKAQKHGKVFKWETTKYGKIWYDEDIHDLGSIETEFPDIAFNDGVLSEKTLSCELTDHVKEISTNISKEFTNMEILKKIMNIRKLDEVISSINGWYMKCGLFGLCSTRDIGRFMKQFRDRVDKIGNNLPTLEVRFQDLTMEADCYIGNTTLPSLPNVVRNSVESLLGSIGVNFSIKTILAILKDASGLIRPSRSIIFWKDNSFVGFGEEAQPQLKGDITYNGHKLNEFVPRRTSTYISQNDVHVGEMLKELTQRVFHEGDVSSLITYYTLKVHAIERTSSMSELNDNADVGEMLEISEAIRDYHDSTRFPHGLRVKSKEVNGLSAYVSNNFYSLGKPAYMLILVNASSFVHTTFISRA
ncbi:ABC transporter G family member 35-like protein isoform X3 [Tanacetum coccineum]